MPLRIAINGLFRASGGSLTNLAQLVREWDASGALDEHRFILFASRETIEGLERQAIGLHKITFEVLTARGAGLVARLWAEQVVLPRRLRHHRADVVFCPGNVVPYATSVPSAVTFQNAAPFCPTVTYRSLRGAMWMRMMMLGMFIRGSARAATKVIFISAYFRDLFVRRFAFPPEKGVVILRGRDPSPPVAADRALEQSHGITKRYLLYVSHLNPYKNVLELIDGFVAACEQGSVTDRQLVIAGMFDNFPWYHRTVVARLGELGARAANIVLTGELPSSDVRKLLAGCESFVFPSTCENCPTALIQALSHALPIGCSNVGPMPEVGGDAVLYFDPFDRASIAEVLVALMTREEVRADLSRRAAERARQLLSESEVAKQTLDVLLAAASS
jgi:glycosyltransferase involved in cell wall biosynthesis